jgi:hypothetical protein
MTNDFDSMAFKRAVEQKDASAWIEFFADKPEWDRIQT